MLFVGSSRTEKTKPSWHPLHEVEELNRLSPTDNMSPRWDDRNHSRLGDLRFHKVLVWKLPRLVRRKSGKTQAPAPADKTTSRHSLSSNSKHASLLDVDLETLRSCRLADGGWLEEEGAPPPPPPPPKNDFKPATSGAELVSSSQTPIAKLFAKSTDQLVIALDTISVAAVKRQAEATSDDGDASSSVLTRGRPLSVASHHQFTTDDASVGLDAAHAGSGEVASCICRSDSRRQTLKTSRAPATGLQRLPKLPVVPDSRSRVSPALWTPPIRQESLLRSVGINTTGLRVTACGGGHQDAVGSCVGGTANNLKRHSMPPPSLPSSEPRRRSWQPPDQILNTTLTGSMGPPLPKRSTSGGSTGSRPPSTALTANRLAWIRELETGRSRAAGDTNKKLKDLAAVGGGIKGKLALFERKEQGPPQPPLLSRSKSNTSRAGRMSWSMATNEPRTTARSSIESTRSLAGAQLPVMAHYDDGFREKMEDLTRQATRQLSGVDKEQEDEKSRDEDGRQKKEEATMAMKAAEQEHGQGRKNECPSETGKADKTNQKKEETEKETEKNHGGPDNLANENKEYEYVIDADRYDKTEETGEESQEGQEEPPKMEQPSSAWPDPPCGDKMVDEELATTELPPVTTDDKQEAGSKGAADVAGQKQATVMMIAEDPESSVDACMVAVARENAATPEVRV